MLIFLDTPVGRLGIDEGVVRAEEREVLATLHDLRIRVAEAEQRMLEAARGEADALLAAARDEAESLVAAALKEAEGLRQRAREEGLTQATREWHEHQVDGAIDKAQALRETHARLADVVTLAVERIVDTEDRTALYQRALKNVQSLTRGASTLRLRVGSVDHDAARACLGTLDMPTAGIEIELMADPTLRPGSCIFESETGVLDASLQTQLDGLRGAMERAVRRAADQAESPDPLLGEAAR
jgi:type III secretion protein L